MGEVEVHSLGYYAVLFVSFDSLRVDADVNNFFFWVFREELFIFAVGKVLDMQIMLEHHQIPDKLVF